MTTFARSLIFVEADNPYLKHASYFSSNNKTFTIASWVKRSSEGTAYLCYFGSGSSRVQISFDSGNHIDARGYSTYDFNLVSTEAVLADDTWHHIQLAMDTTQVVANDRSRLYLDGVEVSYDTRAVPDQNQQFLSSSDSWYIGRSGTGLNYFDGKIDDFHFIDGYQLTPSSFITGTPGNPKDYTSGYGSKGFRLNFEDNSSVAALAYDSSGNGNNWTPYNIDLSDSSTDSASAAIELSATNLAVGSPVLGTPTLTLGDYAYASIAGSLSLRSSATIKGTNVLAADNLVVNQPGFGAPFLLAFDAGTLGTNWSKTAATNIGINLLDPGGGSRSIMLRDSIAAGPFRIWQTVPKSTESQTYRLSFDVAPTLSGKYCKLMLDDGASSYAYAIFDPVTGECLERNCTIDFRFLSVEADPLRYRFKRLVLMAESNTANTVRGCLSLCDSNLAEDYTGSNNGSVIVWNPLLMDGFDRGDFRWEIGEPEMRFYWTAHLANVDLRWFRCGQGELGVDTHLIIKTAPDLDCVLRRWQPGQDDLVFDFSGALLAGSGDPMAGTP